jgi:hypothetical protein
MHSTEEKKSWLARLFSRSQAKETLSLVPVIPPQETVAEDAVSSISEIPSVAPTVMKYDQSYTAHFRGEFLEPEYNLSEVGVIEDTEAFVHQAFKKKAGLMFKEGYEFTGKNTKTIQYLKSRMAQISRASSIPQGDLLKRIGMSLIRTSNAFLIKVRKEEASGGSMRLTPEDKALDPVAAYFPAAPETMKVRINRDTGKITKWRQELPDGRYKDFRPEDVIHFHAGRREGFTFAAPDLVSCKDDIRALRQIEENIEMLLYQNLFPLFHYKVGTDARPAGYTEDGNKEVDQVRNSIRYMPAEGCLVTPERHEIKAIGSEGRAVRAEGYLDYFKKRAIAGLGISQIDLGDGDTTNRATANTLSRILIDTVKDLQDTLELQWNQEVISELLLESTLDGDLLDEENMVYLGFNEIDLQSKMDREKHAAEMFKANALTWRELRSEFGKEPIEVPEDPHERDPSKYPDWHNINWKLFHEPELLIRSMDEAWTPVTHTVLNNPSTAAAPQDLEKAKKEKKEQEARQAKIDAKPKPVAVKDHVLSKQYRTLEEDFISVVTSGYNAHREHNWETILSQSRLWSDQVARQFTSVCMANLIRGFNSQTGGRAGMAAEHISTGRVHVDRRVRHYVDRLADDLVKTVSQQFDAAASNDRLPKYIAYIRSVFQALRYRIDFIYDVETRKSYNFGRVLGKKFLGAEFVEHETHDGSCDRCTAAAESPLPVLFADISEVAPHHASCRCELV